MLAARGYYYEVVKQTQVIPKADELIVTFAQEAQMYAVQLRSNFVHHLAERTAIPDHTSLHICTHNPMVDPYITELYQNFKKRCGSRKLIDDNFAAPSTLQFMLDVAFVGALKDGNMHTIRDNNE